MTTTRGARIRRVSGGATPPKAARYDIPTGHSVTPAFAVVPAEEASVSSPPLEVSSTTVYPFNGVNYTSYLDMVRAKRQRNQDVLEQSGLLSLTMRRKDAVVKSSSSQLSIGIKAQREDASEEASKRPRRSSRRLQGVAADGMYVDDERSGKVTLAGGETVSLKEDSNNSSSNNDRSSSSSYHRIQDGVDMTLSEAIQHVGAKWMTEHSVRDAELLLRDTLVRSTQDPPPPVDEDSSQGMLDELDCTQVAKVCPDRIYSMAVHPSMSDLLVSAGDKSGHVGLWKATTEDVHLFRPHGGAVCALQWTGSTGGGSQNLLSASYDGTIRLLHVEREMFLPVFATYNREEVQFRDQPGYGLGVPGHKFWTQFICLDPRWNSADCFFLATSIGTAMHLDLRVKDPMTFHQVLSEKKINTLSLHPNGYSMISAGLDCTVALWDVRRLSGRPDALPATDANPIASYNGGRSVNSAYFSPSGKYVVSTTMANKLDLFENLHLAGGGNEEVSPSKKKQNRLDATAVLKPYKSIPHDNMTGRWLTTFQAIFHPQLDVFAVGSMRQPRCIELFDPSANDAKASTTVTGDALTAVASRLAFHPRADECIIVGGNSSGRATIVRKK